MDRLVSLLERRRWLVLGAWVVLLIASLPFMARQTEHLKSGGFSVPGSGSEAVDRALPDFRGAQHRSLSVVVARQPGGDAGDVRRELARAARIVDAVPDAELGSRALATARADASHSAVVIAAITTSGGMDRTAEQAIELRERLLAGERPNSGAEAHLVGEAALWAGLQDLSKHDLAKAEAIGFPIVLLILLAVFGSLVAAALPLALGFVSVAITGAGVFFLSQATEMSIFVTNVASMIGIGVAVDYSLFILARYREEARTGMPLAEARRLAMRTSGVAVTFSGITVIVSLAALFLIDSAVLRSMAMGAVLVVAISILAAITFLPALMVVIGRRGYAPGRPAAAIAWVTARLGRLRRRSRHETASRLGFWQGWTASVTRRPILTALLSAGFMLVLAVPALSLKTGDGALRQLPEDSEARMGAELAAEKLGPGATGPVEVVARFDRGTMGIPSNRRPLRHFVTELRRDPGVAAMEGPVPSHDQASALLIVTSRHDPESKGARALVDRMRHGAPGGAALAQVANLDVGGATASVEDFRVQVSDSLWKIALFVLTFCYLVLFVLLRSVLLPLKAVVMNLLTVGAAYGVLVAIFQRGWLDGFLGFQSLGYVHTMTPALLLAVVFGLSMDYEVFLLSRIKERYAITGDSTVAVTQGLASSAATISSAALIMVAVFTVFAGVGIPSVKEIGVGLAVAIALDATVVRLVLVPATMEILGRWNWWLPRQLDRVLPRASLEFGSASPAAHRSGPSSAG
jgi:RND superfamily putative drug exporter